jgi:dimethylargininase
LTERSYEFSRAITRKPAASIVDGLRAQDYGNPDLAQMLADHEHYVTTLRETGAEVIELPALEAFRIRCLSKMSRCVWRKARF